jgi:GTP cyclohydrolase FolE2
MVHGDERKRAAGRVLQVESGIHEQIVRECVDVPEQVPSFALPLTAVGISGKTVWISLPQGKIPFDGTIDVDLPGNRRGIHMSRIEDVIGRLHDRQFLDLRHYAQELARQVLDLQYAAHCRVDLSGKVPIVRNSSVSGKKSIDTVEISAEVIVKRLDTGQGMTKTAVGIGVNHITACPCTQAYNRVLFGEERDCPLPTHSQRSFTRLVMSDTNGRPTYAEMLHCLEVALHVTQDLLKRSDEAELVLQSHRRPQFIEDAVRETAKAVGGYFAAILPGETAIQIEALSLESIHIHDVRCHLEVALSQIIEHL